MSYKGITNILQAVFGKYRIPHVKWLSLSKDSIYVGGRIKIHMHGSNLPKDSAAKAVTAPIIPPVAVNN